MRILVNGEARDVEARTLGALLLELDCADALVATALNLDFVRAGDRDGTRLQPGDRIEIVSPRQGG